jgi:hemerythrin-like domain-containing protein
MCGHCGCGGVPAIGELREEHLALQEQAHGVRRALADGDRPTALDRLARLTAHLGRHVEREERGVFTALRDEGEFAEEVEALEGEHVALDVAIDALDPRRDDFRAAVTGLLAELDRHIEREDLGIFPVSVVTLGAAGWATVDRAHADLPTFLTERTPT